MLHLPRSICSLNIMINLTKRRIRFLPNFIMLFKNYFFGEKDVDNICNKTNLIKNSNIIMVPSLFCFPLHLDSIRTLIADIVLTHIFTVHNTLYRYLIINGFETINKHKLQSLTFLSVYPFFSIDIMHTS